MHSIPPISSGHLAERYVSCNSYVRSACPTERIAQMLKKLYCTALSDKVRRTQQLQWCYREGGVAIGTGSLTTGVRAEMAALYAATAGVAGGRPAIHFPLNEEAKRLGCGQSRGSQPVALHDFDGLSAALISPSPASKLPAAHLASTACCSSLSERSYAVRRPGRGCRRM